MPYAATDDGEPALFNNQLVQDLIWSTEAHGFYVSHP